MELAYSWSCSSAQTNNSKANSVTHSGSSSIYPPNWLGARTEALVIAEVELKLLLPMVGAPGASPALRKV